jgi:hypothetical protein
MRRKSLCLDRDTFASLRFLADTLDATYSAVVRLAVGKLHHDVARLAPADLAKLRERFKATQPEPCRDFTSESTAPTPQRC